MITPGLVIITVGFIWYLVAGFPEASVAVPCYLFTVIPAPNFKKISKNQSTKAFVDGVIAAVIVIATITILDIPTTMIAVANILVLLYIKKFSKHYVIAVAAVLGIFIKLILWTEQTF